MTDLIYGLYSRARAGRWTKAAVLEWAVRREYRLYRITRDKSPGLGSGYFYLVEAVDSQHVRRKGRVRVDHKVVAAFSVYDDAAVTVTWLDGRQLDWRDQAPRAGPPPPDGSAQGWHADPTGRHELRWYSAGTPTSLVKDGAAEGHDTP
ncbi:hypothetical protein ACQPZX_19385 [Actinoplanes sp. CA-142083]|uniref:hypothetical protein n=1 Tax=Actinoplanes sp. CA-142083 TaxID=3239903 RepID=UPI003D8DBD96